MPLYKDARPLEVARNYALQKARDHGFEWVVQLDNDNFLPGCTPLDIIASARPKHSIIGLTYGIVPQPGEFDLLPPSNGAHFTGAFREVRGTTLVVSEALPATPWHAGVLLGIAFYALPYLQFLDDVVIQSRDSASPNVQVHVFGVLGLKSMQDVGTVFPGLAPTYGTPMIGVWASGQLVQKGWGVREARRIARGLFTQSAE